MVIWERKPADHPVCLCRRGLHPLRREREEVHGEHPLRYWPAGVTRAVVFSRFIETHSGLCLIGRGFEPLSD